MSNTPLAWIALATLVASLPPSALAGPTDDLDGDRLPDDAERLACSSGASQLVINTAGQGRVWCVGSAGLDYAIVVTGVVVVPAASADADNDGFPETISLLTQQWTINPKNAGLVSAQTTGTTTIRVDPDDANPQIPLASVVPLPAPLVTDVDASRDCDADGLPDDVQVYEERFTFDRRVVPQVVSNGGAWFKVADVDPQRCVPLTDDPVIHLILEAAADTADIARGVYDNLDLDHDLVPDVLEPSLCFAQSGSLPQDGSCVGNDYTPPPPNAIVPPLPPAVGSEVEELRGFLLEGRCWRPPPRDNPVCWA